jgi:hypothetical protein
MLNLEEIFKTFYHQNVKKTQIFVIVIHQMSMVIKVLMNMMQIINQQKVV